MAIHTFHELVFSSLQNMEKASWGYCVLVVDSSGELAAPPEDAPWFRKCIRGWACHILRFSTQPCKESFHGLCINFVTFYHIVLAMFGTVA